MWPVCVTGNSLGWILIDAMSESTCYGLINISCQALSAKMCYYKDYLVLADFEGFQHPCPIPSLTFEPQPNECGI